MLALTTSPLLVDVEGRPASLAELIEMNHDHNNIRVLRGVSPVAIGTTGTGKTSAVIDRQSYGGVEFLLAFGTITATGAVARRDRARRRRDRRADWHRVAGLGLARHGSRGGC